MAESAGPASRQLGCDASSREEAILGAGSTTTTMETPFERAQRERHEEAVKKDRQETVFYAIAIPLIIIVAIAARVGWEMLRAWIWKGTFQP